MFINDLYLSWDNKLNRKVVKCILAAIENDIDESQAAMEIDVDESHVSHFFIINKK